MFAVFTRSARDMRSAARHGLDEEVVRHAELLEFLAAFSLRTTKSSISAICRLLDLQTQRDQHQRALFVLRVLLAQRADERHLPGLRIADEQPVRPLADHRPPRAIADGEALAVFRELDLPRQAARALDRASRTHRETRSTVPSRHAAVARTRRLAPKAERLPTVAPGPSEFVSCA